MSLDICATRHATAPVGGIPVRPMGEALVELDGLARAVGEHLDGLGVERCDWVRVCKVAEEAGEAVGALIKGTQGRATETDVQDELADVILAALGAINQLGLQPGALLGRRWAQVSARTRDRLTKSASALAGEQVNGVHAPRSPGARRDG